MQVRVDSDRRRGRLLVVGLVAVGVSVMVGTALAARAFSGSGRGDDLAAPPEVLHDCLAMVETIGPEGTTHTTGLLMDDGRHVVVAGDGFGQAGRIAVRIGGARTSAAVVAEDSYMDLTVVRLETPSGSAPDVASEVDPGDPVRLVHFDDSGMRRSTSARVAATGLVWSRPDHTIADDVLMVDGVEADSGVLAGPDGRVAGLVIGTQEGHAVAYPAQALSSVVSRLMETGGVEHPWIGVRAGDVDDAAEFLEPVGQSPVSVPTEGAHVIEVVPGSPAEHAGIAAGDVIHALDGHPVSDLAALVALISPLSPGDVVTIDLNRSGDPVRVEVEVAAFPG